MPAGIGLDGANARLRSTLQHAQPPSLDATSQADYPRSTRLRSSESWIEVSSLPSSSLPGTPSHDTGPPVDVIANYEHTSRTRVRRSVFSPLTGEHDDRRPSVDCSSQEEYEESESESDKVLTSSNEYIPPSASSPAETTQEDSGESSDSVQAEVEIDGSVTVTLPSGYQCFTPQPNAFSHPPSSHLRHTDAVPGSYFPAPNPAQRSSTSRQSSAGHQQRQHHTAPHTDHDAALRASLSTLLSCAAAARGLPKSRSSHQLRANGNSGRIDTRTLRVVPEEVAMGETSRSMALTPGGRETSKSSRGSSAADNAHELSKRKASRSTSKDRRGSKKPRRLAIDECITPTLLTWVTAAGVVVLVSAISFSTGFVMGKETGRLEASGGLRSAAAGTSNCSSEAARGLGLKRLRWSGATSVGA